MTRNQSNPWLRICAESVAIVGSILLAFAIDAWWSERIERDLESQYLERLLGELRTNADTRDFIFQLAEAKTEALAALDMILRRPSDSRTIAEAAANMAEDSTNLGWALPEFTDVVFEELQSTGRLGIIRDVELRTKLVGYYEEIANTVERIDNRRTDFAPYIYRLIPPEVYYDQADLDDLTEDRLSTAIEGEDFRQVFTAERNYADFIEQRMEALHPQQQEVETALMKALNGDAS